ncbi:hypothetical protein ACIRJS_16545 [Streptomyces sp. NPDC102340]|uniref:hypothetical protein n=1 Tax=unclassified Streptomyces TaxID=2593676 RepID=UPI0037F8A0AE
MTQYTPNLNLPYPEAGDAPRGNEQIQALATALDGQAGPVFKMGVLATVEANIRDDSQWTYSYGQVHLAGLFGSNAAFNTNQVTVGTIPAALDPVLGTARMAVAMTGVGNNLAVGRLTVTTGLVVSLDLAPGTTWGNASSIYVSGISWFPSDPAAALAYFNSAA